MPISKITKIIASILSTITATLALVLASCSTQQQGSQQCQVTGVQDGDTITCLLPEQITLRIRLDQIDAPEKGQPFGSTAKKHLSNKIFGKTVQLKLAGTDRYGRTLAEIYLDGSNINKEMVRDGYAWSYTQYVRDPQYNSLQAQAQSEQRGLWADPAPVYPSHFRRSKRPATP